MSALLATSCICGAPKTRGKRHCRACGYRLRRTRTVSRCLDCGGPTTSTLTTRCGVCFAQVRSTVGYASRSAGEDRNTPGTLPAEPCPYPPGSEGKILAMIARVERWEKLHHPGDARHED